MRHEFLDRYSRIDSVVHRFPTTLKILVSIGLILSIVLIPAYQMLFYVITFTGLIIVGVLSRIPLYFFARRILLLEPFVVGIAVLLLFQPNGGKIFLSVVTKSTLCLFTMVLLSNTTPFGDLLNFLKRIHIPALLVTIFALMYRYIFVLIDEVEKMNRARMSRTFTRSRTHIWKSRAVLIGQLFVRSTERAERIYASMRSRGWR